MSRQNVSEDELGLPLFRLRPTEEKRAVFVQPGNEDMDK